MNLWLTSFRVWIQLPFMCAVCDLTRWNDWSHLLRKQERDSCAISNTYTQNDTVWIGSAFAIKRTISFRHSHEYITAAQLAVCHQYVGKKSTVRWWFSIECVFTRFKLQLNISPVSLCPYLWKIYCGWNSFLFLSHAGCQFKQHQPFAAFKVLHTRIICGIAFFLRLSSRNDDSN